MSVFIILNGINSGQSIGDFCVRVLRNYHIHMHIHGNRYTFHNFLALNSTHIIPKVPNLISNFVLNLTIIFLSFIDWRCGWSVFCTCEYENFLCTLCIHGNRYTFRSFLALNCTHIISEVPKLINTFVLTLVIIFLSFFDWQCGWSMFCTCKYENFLYTRIHGNQYIFHAFLALNSTHNIPEIPHLNSTFVLMSVIVL